jgi:small nuclear ribonucleoprotein (snRNP)-like protein
MTDTSTKNNKKIIHKSLGSLLRYMEGIEVIVELKTGKRHRGILTAADEFMNLTLEQSQSQSQSQQRRGTEEKEEQWDPAQQESLLLLSSSLDIRGPTIRYIQFPDNADLTSTVTMGVERERTAAKKYSRGKRK